MKSLPGHKHSSSHDNTLAFMHYQEISIAGKADLLREFLNRLYTYIISPIGWPEEETGDLQYNIKIVQNAINYCWLEHREMQKRKKSRKEKHSVDLHKPGFSDYRINEYYPQLQVSSWPKTRRERFKGNLLLLTQNEVDHTYDFYENLFNHRGLKDWKQLLNKWISYAMDNGKTILDGENVSAISIYEDYQYLQKTIEIIWLTNKQESDLQYHEMCPWFDMNNYPVFASGDHLYNAYDELYGFFHWETLMSYQSVLDKWINFACDIKRVWDGPPDNLVELFREFCRLTECCWLIQILGPNYPEHWNYIHTHYIGKRVEDPDESYKYRLPAVMIKKPENYLKLFFKSYTINEVFHILFDCLYTALGTMPPYPYNYEEFKDFGKACSRLLEAAYLIQKQKYPERMDKTE